LAGAAQPPRRHQVGGDLRTLRPARLGADVAPG